MSDKDSLCNETSGTSVQTLPNLACVFHINDPENAILLWPGSCFSSVQSGVMRVGHVEGGIFQDKIVVHSVLKS